MKALITRASNRVDHAKGKTVYVVSGHVTEGAFKGQDFAVYHHAYSETEGQLQATEIFASGLDNNLFKEGNKVSVVRSKVIANAIRNGGDGCDRLFLHDALATAGDETTKTAKQRVKIRCHDFAVAYLGEVNNSRRGVSLNTRVVHISLHY